LIKQIKNDILMKPVFIFLLFMLCIFYCLADTQSSVMSANAIAIAAEPANKSGSDPNIKLVNVPYSAVAKLPQLPAEKTVKYGSDPEQYFLFWPADSSETIESRAPVIMIHGGCWLSAFDIRHSIAQANGLAQAGHDVYSIEYRRSGETGGGWPVTFADVMLGLTAIIDALPKSTSTVNLIGHSAGGHLALLAAADIQRHLAVLEHPELTLNIVGLAAIVDIKQYALGLNSCQAVTSDFMAGMPDEKVSDYYLANPLNHALSDTALAKITLLQGDADTIVPISQARHPNARTIIEPGAGHFDWIHPQSSAFQTLLGVLQ
jgi:acetyl esterase/lipase